MFPFVFVPADEGQQLDGAGEKQSRKRRGIEAVISINRGVKQGIHTAHKACESVDSRLEHTDYQGNIKRKYPQKILPVVYAENGDKHRGAHHKNKNDYVFF